MSDTTPLLRVADIETFYGPIQAIRGVTLEVQAGQIVTVLGWGPTRATTRTRSPAIWRCVTAISPG